MSILREKYAVMKSILRTPQIIRAKPSINLFFLQYMNKFRVREIGGNVIIHSHLPPLNSPAYTRFVDEQLLAKSTGPSHAQIGVTNACPQKCAYCYNRNRTGRVMDTDTILQVIRDLKAMGVVWMGFTGGEPLLNKNLVKITKAAADGCAVKLFTTGCTLTGEKANDLANAGLFSVSVSLDHWQEQEHDRNRGYPGAFRAALRAIELCKATDRLHVSVSAVLSKKMLRENQVEEFLQFLISLGVHEAWLSEAKPSVADFCKEELIITEDERLDLVRLQDRYNKEGEITVNYLGHFEGKEYFGCNAGHKMVYVDAFGEVSPCVFTPMTFGNVMDRTVAEIFHEMKSHFPSENSCFINKNYRLMQEHARGKVFLDKDDSVAMLEQVRFGPMARFFQLYYR